jgi:hypothetical protein
VGWNNLGLEGSQVKLTAAEGAKLIGQTGYYQVGELSFCVEIQDVRNGGWGRTEYQIQPSSGIGLTWVNADRVKLPEGVL